MKPPRNPSSTHADLRGAYRAFPVIPARQRKDSSRILHSGGIEQMATVQLDVERVRAYMAQQGWSEQELAKQMGIAYSYVNRLLSGKRQVGPRAIAGLALAGCEWQAVLRIVPDSAKP